MEVLSGCIISGGQVAKVSSKLNEALGFDMVIMSGFEMLSVHPNLSITASDTV